MFFGVHEPAARERHERQVEVVTELASIQAQALAKAHVLGMRGSDQRRNARMRVHGPDQGDRRLACPVAT